MTKDSKVLFFDKNKPVKDDTDTKNSSPDGGFHIGDSI